MRDASATTRVSKSRDRTWSNISKIHVRKVTGAVAGVLMCSSNLLEYKACVTVYGCNVTDKPVDSSILGYVSIHSSGAALKTEAASSSEMFVTIYQTTRRHSPKEWDFQTYRTHLWISLAA